MQVPLITSLPIKNPIFANRSRLLIPQQQSLSPPKEDSLSLNRKCHTDALKFSGERLGRRLFVFGCLPFTGLTICGVTTIGGWKIYQIGEENHFWPWSSHPQKNNTGDQGDPGTQKTSTAKSTPKSISTDTPIYVGVIDNKSNRGHDDVDEIVSKLPQNDFTYLRQRTTGSQEVGQLSIVEDDLSANQKKFIGIPNGFLRKDHVYRIRPGISGTNQYDIEYDIKYNSNFSDVESVQFAVFYKGDGHFLDNLDEQDHRESTQAYLRDHVSPDIISPYITALANHERASAATAQTSNQSFMASLFDPQSYQETRNRRELFSFRKKS